MYKLFIDTPELFEANIQIEGADIEKTKCRLNLQCDKYSILFEGTIENNTAKIPVSSLKNLMKEGDTGIIKLEVIAEDTYFTPWVSDYYAAVSKKVVAEVKDAPNHKINESFPKIKISEVVVKNSNNSLQESFINKLISKFKTEQISFLTVKKDINKIKRITSEINKDFKIPSTKLLECVTTALNNIKI